MKCTPIGPEEYLNRTVAALDIALDRRPKGSTRKVEAKL